MLESETKHVLRSVVDDAGEGGGAARRGGAA